MVWVRLPRLAARSGRNSCFGLGGKDSPDRFKQAAGVEPVDPFEGGELDGLERPPRAASMDHLGLVQAVVRLGQRAVADASDGRLGTSCGEALGVAQRKGSRTPVAVRRDLPEHHGRGRPHARPPRGEIARDRHLVQQGRGSAHRPRTHGRRPRHDERATTRARRPAQPAPRRRQPRRTSRARLHRLPTDGEQSRTAQGGRPRGPRSKADRAAQRKSPRSPPKSSLRPSTRQTVARSTLA